MVKFSRNETVRNALMVFLRNLVQQNMGTEIKPMNNLNYLEIRLFCFIPKQNWTNPLVVNGCVMADREPEASSW